MGFTQILVEAIRAIEDQTLSTYNPGGILSPHPLPLHFGANK
jgi:hypothetical protein